MTLKIWSATYLERGISLKAAGKLLLEVKKKGLGCQLEPLNHLSVSLYGEITWFACKKYVYPVLFFYI